jgi:hypothetical protein
VRLSAAHRLHAVAHLSRSEGSPGLHIMSTRPLHSCVHSGVSARAPMHAQGGLAVPQVALELEALLVAGVGAQPPGAGVEQLAEALALAGLRICTRGSKQQEGEGTERAHQGGRHERALLAMGVKARGRGNK